MTEPITSFTDWRGNEVRVGDPIVYAAMSGRSCQMIEGRLTRINYNDKSKPDKITSVSVLASRGSRWGRYGGESVATLTVYENVTRLNESVEEIVVPATVRPLGWYVLEDHLRNYHYGKSKEVTALRNKLTIKQSDLGTYHPTISDEKQDEYTAALQAAHDGCHASEVFTVPHTHSADNFTHDWYAKLIETKEGTVKQWNKNLPAVKEPVYQQQFWYRGETGRPRQISHYKWTEGYLQKEKVRERADGLFYGAYEDVPHTFQRRKLTCRYCDSPWHLKDGTPRDRISHPCPGVKEEGMPEKEPSSYEFA